MVPHIHRFAALSLVAILAAGCEVDPSLAFEAQQISTGGDPAVVARRLINLQEFDGSSLLPTPDGVSVVYTRQASPDTVELVISDYDGGNARTLSTGRDSYATRISRDGEWIAFNWMGHADSYEGYELRVVRRDGTGERTILLMDLEGETHVSWAEAVDWSPDGRALLAMYWMFDGSGQLVSHSMDDGSETILRAFGWESPSAAAFSPDGKYIVYNLPEVGKRTEDLFILAADGSREARLTNAPGAKRPIGWSADGRALYYAIEEFGHDRPISSVWRLPIQDGYRPGTPSLIRGDLVGSRVGDFVGHSFAGDRILYRVRSETSGNEILSMTVDLESGRVVVPPSRFMRAPQQLSSITWSRDGQHLWYLRPPTGERRGLEFVMRSATNGEEFAIPLDLDTYSVTATEWDERSVVVRGRSRGREQAYRVDLVSGSVAPHEYGPDDLITGQNIENGDTLTAAVQYSADRSVRYFMRPADGEFELVAQSLASREEQVLFRGRVDGAMFQNKFRLSPDESKVVVVHRRSYGADLLVIDLHTRNSAVAFESEGPRFPDGSRGLGLAGTSLNWSSDGRYLVFVRVEGEDIERGDTRHRRVAIWMAHADGSGAQQFIGDLPFATATSVRLNPDNRRVVFAIPEEPTEAVDELWVLENLIETRGAQGARAR